MRQTNLRHFPQAFLKYNKRQRFLTNVSSRLKTALSARFIRTLLSYRLVDEEDYYEKDITENFDIMMDITTLVTHSR